MNRRVVAFLMTHAIAGVIGWNLVSRGDDRGSPEEVEDSARAGRVVSRSSTRNVGSGAGQGVKLNDFYSLWSSLPDQELSTKDRIEAQRRILEEWALVDLEGALRAMLAEAWWAGEEPFFFNGNLEGPFGSAFARAFREDPDGSWELVTSGDFGIGVTMLRRAWYQAMRFDPVALAEKLGDVPGDEVDEVLWLIMDGNLEGAGVREEVVRLLKALPEETVSTREIMRALPQISLEEARAAFEAVEDFSTRDGLLAAFQYGEARFIGENFEGLRSYRPEDLADYQEVMAGLPQESQGSFLYSLLAGSFSIQTVMGIRERTFDLLNLMVEGEHWEALDQARNLSLIRQGGGFSGKDGADWAATLPERPEVAEFFEDAAQRYFQEEKESVQGWIDDLPEGMWRDRSLALQSKLILANDANLGESRAVIAGIQDAEIRRAAEKHHGLYEKAVEKR